MPFIISTILKLQGIIFNCEHLAFYIELSSSQSALYVYVKLFGSFVVHINQVNFIISWWKAERMACFSQRKLEICEFVKVPSFYLRVWCGSVSVYGCHNHSHIKQGSPNPNPGGARCGPWQAFNWHAASFWFPKSL